MRALRTRRVWLPSARRMAGAAVLLLFAVGLFNTHKPLPAGLSFTGEWHGGADVRFLRDLTFTDEAGQRHVEQQIFDAAFALLDGAQRFVLVDMFLFNDFQGASPERTRALCRELTERLVARRTAMPDIEIHLITDPINTVYDGLSSPTRAAARSGCTGDRHAPDSAAGQQSAVLPILAPVGSDVGQRPEWLATQSLWCGQGEPAQLPRAGQFQSQPSQGGHRRQPHGSAWPGHLRQSA